MSQPFNLQDKSILVTGATSGIGRACVGVIKGSDGRAFATGRNTDRFNALNCNGLLADLCVPEDRVKLTNAAPGLSGVVFAAGASLLKPVKYCEEETINELVQINLNIQLAFLQELLKAKRIQNGASLVFIASIAGLVGGNANVVYAATKGAIIAMVRSLAVELSRLQIRVNAISPGWLRSPMTEGLKDSTTTDSMRVEESKYLLAGGSVDDVANAALFLLSDASKWITGTNLVVDGGYTCQ